LKAHSKACKIIAHNFQSTGYFYTGRVIRRTVSRHQTAGQNYDIKLANRCFENVAKFRYLGTTITNQNLIQEEIKRRLNSGNSVQNLLSSRLLSKNLKIKICKTLILPLVLYGCKTWSLILKEKKQIADV
jgi:hypothetical protein